LGDKDINTHEPKPTVCKSTPPRSLTDPAAKRLYRQYAKELTKLGVLTTIDRDELTRICDLYTEANKFWAIYKEQPRVTHSIRGPEINPAYRQHRKASPTLARSSSPSASGHRPSGVA
jgi:phage terminase small subunit